MTPLKPVKTAEQCARESREATLRLNRRIRAFNAEKHSQPLTQTLADKFSQALTIKGR